MIAASTSSTLNRSLDHLWVYEKVRKAILEWQFESGQDYEQLRGNLLAFNPAVDIIWWHAPTGRYTISVVLAL